MKITNTELNVVRFASEDVIATSGLVGSVWSHSASGGKKVEYATTR